MGELREDKEICKSLVRSDTEEEVPPVESNNLGDDDEFSKLGGGNNDARDVRDSFGDEEEQSSAHEHEVDHSHAGNERQTRKDPANAENDQADNGESSDLESALDNPCGVYTVIANIDVAGNAGTLSARVPDAALPPDEPSGGAADESTMTTMTTIMPQRMSSPTGRSVQANIMRRRRRSKRTRATRQDGSCRLCSTWLG